MSRDRARVVLTRLDDTLAAEVARRGHRVLVLPCVRIAPADAGALADAVRALGPDDCLVVTSAHGAAAILRAVAPSEIRARVSVVGSAARERFAEGGIVAELAPSADGASLARWLALPRGRVLLARSDRALPDLPAILRNRGARVDEVIAYRTVAEAHGDVAAVRASAARAVVVFASPSAVDAFLAAVPERPAAVVAIGPTTASQARARLGVDPVVAARPETVALADAIDRAVREMLHVVHA